MMRNTAKVLEEFLDDAEHFELVDGSTVDITAASSALTATQVEIARLREALAGAVELAVRWRARGISESDFEEVPEIMKARAALALHPEGKGRVMSLRERVHLLRRELCEEVIAELDRLEAEIARLRAELGRGVAEARERSMSDGDRDLEDRLRWLVIEGRKRHWTLDMASELATKAPALLDLIERLKRRQGSGA